MKKSKKIASCAAAALCALALAGCASQTASGAAAGGSTAVEQTPTITVNATSEVSAVPDKAKVGVAVTTQAATAQDTQDANAEGVNAVIDALKALGIDEKSIQTTDTYLSPRYDYSTPVYPVAESEVSAVASPETEIDSVDAEDDSTNIVGYEQTTRLSISDLDIDQVGTVLKEAVAAGATNSDGIQYYSSEYDTLYQQALEHAVADARTKAEVLAKASGVNLGGVFSVQEGYENTSYRYDTGAMYAMAESAADEAMTVMPGEVDIQAQVTVSYEIS